MVSPPVQPFVYLVEDYKELSGLTELVENSFRLVDGMTHLMTVMNKTDPSDYAKPSFEEDSIERATKIESFAAEQVSKGIPIIYSALTIYAWGRLGVAFRDCMARILEFVPETRGIPEIRKIKVPLVDFGEMSEPDRWRYIISLLARDTGAEFRRGLGVFEALSKPFGITPIMDDENRRNLIEMREVRNVIVHNFGRADRRFLDACPWIASTEGDTISVSRASFGRYIAASMSMAASTIEAVCQRYYPNSPLFEENESLAVKGDASTL